MKWLIGMGLLAAAPAHAALPPAALDEVGVTPPADARLPGGGFVDQAGRELALAPGRTPTVLLFADYSCRHLCGPGLTLTAGALHDAGLVAGKDYRLVVVGLDQDGPAVANAFGQRTLGALPAERAGALLLTGPPATVAAAEGALGYHAVHDPAVDQFAHDAASFVFTTDGRLSRVLPETAVTSSMLVDAVAAARRGESLTPAEGSSVSRLIAVCYGFAAAHGVHGHAVVTALRIAGVATLIALTLMVTRLGRRRRLG